jgi:hypothetical protein
MKRLAFVFAAFVGAAQAAEIQPVLKVGVDFGGRTIVVAEFTNGDTERIGAHEGFYLGGGVAYLPTPNLELNLTAAYKFATIEARNGDIEWTRWPVDALAFYRWPRFRAGGGLTYHVAPRLDGDGAAEGLDVRFKNALGAVVQADWRITEHMFLGVRFTALTYKAKDPVEEDARSNGWGIAFSYNF